jgi:hypothetical protein
VEVELDAFDGCGSAAAGGGRNPSLRKLLRRLARSTDPVRVLRTRRGARLAAGGAVFSEILAAPGPTHSVFDVLAACVAALAAGPRVALLGFAGGGMIAPLRAMGCALPVEAVDLDLSAEPLFRRLSRGWAGAVRVVRDDATRWLRRPRAPYHVVVDDLAVLGASGVEKPAESLGGLPALAASRLAPRGLFVSNLLPAERLSWKEAVARVRSPFARAAVVLVGGFENRVVLGGEALEPPRALAARLRAALRGIGSRVAIELRSS